MHFVYRKFIYRPLFKKTEGFLINFFITILKKFIKDFDIFRMNLSSIIYSKNSYKIMII